jgi:proteasome lid subunit RPN8/RPN11
MNEQPAALLITQSAYGEMLEAFRKELPREGCGFLAGRKGLAHRFYSIHNINPDRRRFLMDPRHVRRTETSIFRRGQRILAVCHSHPEGECHPSRWDIAGAFFDPEFRMPLWEQEVQVIALLSDPNTPVVRGFLIRSGGEVIETRLEVVPDEVGIFSTSP